MQRHSYTEANNGEWFRIERSGRLISCCSCGLVHLVRSRLRGNSIEIAATRLPRNTGGKRKAMGVRVIKKRPKK